MDSGLLLASTEDSFTWTGEGKCNPSVTPDRFHLSPVWSSNKLLAHRFVPGRRVCPINIIFYNEDQLCLRCLQSSHELFSCYTENAGRGQLDKEFNVSGKLIKQHKFKSFLLMREMKWNQQIRLPLTFVHPAPFRLKSPDSSWKKRVSHLWGTWIRRLV